ncbi:hypothetical protein Tco_0203915, partial [Tanacetum coccineum]
MMAGPIMNDYISATRKSFILNDNNGKMIEKNFIKIEGAFLVKIRDNAFNRNDGENVFEHINSFLEVVEPLKVRGLIERFGQKFYNLYEHDEEEETEDDDDPHVIDNVPKSLRSKTTYLTLIYPCAFREFNYLLKIDPDLFTYDIQEFKTQEEYEQELNNNKIQGLEEPWSENE